MIKHVFKYSMLLSIFFTPATTKAEDFYKYKTITLIIGSAPGGSINLYSREVARFLGNHIPGNPEIIVRNMPGANTLVAVRAIDTVHPKDGTVLTNFSESLISQALLQPEIVNVDFTKFNYVSAIESEPRLCYSYGPKGVKSWSEIQAGRTFTYGTSVTNSDVYVNGNILKKYFNAPINIIPGYIGSKALPVENGELDGDCLFYSSIPQNWITNNSVNFFLRFAQKKPSYIPDSAEFIGDFAKTDQQKKVLVLFELQHLLYRPIIVSKDVPADRVQILRESFISLMKDQAFHDALAKVKIVEVKPLDVVQAEQGVKKLLNMDKEVIDSVRSIIK
jgi:tripartite-type tricarboxylate transporter receptor subunit TctC